jgi:hypothetical protein
MAVAFGFTRAQRAAGCLSGSLLSRDRLVPEAKVTGQAMGFVFPCPSVFFKERYIMADIINELASKCGISPDMAKKGLGALLAGFKHALPAESFAKIEGAIPGAADMIADAQPQGEVASGGLFAAIKDMAGKLFGGGASAEALAAHFGKLGFSHEQVECFIPRAVEFLKGILPPDLMKHISALLPHEQGASAG